MDEIRIVVVDDHPFFRQGVIDAMSFEPDIQVIGQADNGEDGLELIRDQRPTVAIVDVNLPGINGQQVARQVVADKLPTRVILLTAYDDDEQRIHGMSVGAAAYCTKDIKPEAMVEIVRSVAKGLYIINQTEYDAAGVAAWLDERVGGWVRQDYNLGEVYVPLSPREMEVLIYITQGLSNKEIATLLGISHQTVKNHVTAILRKLGVGDRTQAALYALRRGWVHLYQHDH